MNAIVDFLTEGTVTGELLAELGGLLSDIPEVPSLITDLGLYQAKGMLGTTVEFDVVRETASLVPISTRGTDARRTAGATRQDPVFFKAVRIAEEAHIGADDALDKRQLGTMEPATVRQLLIDLVATAVRNVRVTREWHMLGGLKGQVLDADGSVITNLYTKLGVTKPATVFLELDKASPKMGDLRKQFGEIGRAIKAGMAGSRHSGFAAIAGDDLFDALVTHKEVRETYLNQAAAAELRGEIGDKVTFGGATIYRYDGSVGGVDFLEADEARFFPLGSDAFQQRFAPKDRLRDEAELGSIEYALPFVDPKGRFQEVEIQSNPATFMTRPKALIEVRAGGEI